MDRGAWRGKRYVVVRHRVVEACIRLGITDAVQVRITDYWGGETAGRVIGFDASSSWRIGLDTYLGAAEASRTLWHELIHVRQAQQMGGLDQLDARVIDALRTARLLGRGQRRWFRNWAYRSIPTEREAERLARRWHAQLPLAFAR